MSIENQNGITQTFPVLGLSCVSCANSVEKVVRNQEGVVDASVDFAAKNITITYLTAVIDEAKLKKAVQSAGYDLVVEEK